MCQVYGRGNAGAGLLWYRDAPGLKKDTPEISNDKGGINKDKAKMIQRQHRWYKDTAEMLQGRIGLKQLYFFKCQFNSLFFYTAPRRAKFVTYRRSIFIYLLIYGFV